MGIDVPICTKSLMTKGEIYDFLINKMKEAGWEDLASNPSTEGNIMHSTGVDGDQDIFVQIFAWDVAGVTSDVRTTNSILMRIRTLVNYVPGLPGANGTITRTGDNIFRFYMYQTTVTPDVAECPIYWYIDKNLVIFCIRPASSLLLSSYRGNLLTFGVPKNLYSNSGELLRKYYGDRDTFITFYTSGTSTTTTTYDIGAGIYTLNNPFGATTLTTPLNNTLYTAPSPIFFEFDGRATAHNITYGTATFGRRAFIEGIYAIISSAAGSISEADTFTDVVTGYKYIVVIIAHTVVQFSSTITMLRIE